MEKSPRIEIGHIASALFESAAEGLVVTNSRGIIEAVNPQVTELFGFTEQELLGETIEILIPQRFHGNHSSHRQKYAKKPVKRTMGNGMELEGQHKLGHCFPVEVSLNHFAVGEERMFMALISDVTERKKTDDALKKLNQQLEQKVLDRTRDLKNSQDLYRLISRNFPNGIINVFDRDLNYIFVEGQELYKLGINSKRLIGTNYLDRLAPELRNDIKSQLMAAFEGRNSSFEINHRENVYMLNAVGLPGDKDGIEQILVVEQNITKMKKVEQNMLEALEKERELGELKSRFVSMASHEFRTPLTTVQSSLSLLKKYVSIEDSQEKQEKHFQRIGKSVNHLVNILNDFLSIDKLEEGMVQLQLTDVSVPELINDLVDEMRQGAEESQQISYTHKGIENVRCDKHVLKNILNNLLSNAIKYSGSQGAIKVSTRVKGKWWFVEVQDDGIGIPKEEQQYLFDRFFRARNAINIQGTGLGLSIIGKYVDLLGGQIDFKSAENQGTTFTVKLPVNPELTPI